MTTLLFELLGAQVAPGVDTGDAPAKSTRAALNLFFRSSLQLIHALMSRQLRDCVLLQGDFLLYRSGPLSLCDTGLVRRALASLWRRQPFVLLHADADADGPGLRALCELLELDAAAQLSGFLTYHEIMIVFGEQDGRPVVSKLASAAAGEAYLAPQHKALEWFARNGADTPVARHVPEVLAFKQTKDYGVLVQSRLPGAPTDPAAVTEAELERRLALAAAPLIELHRRGAPDEAHSGEFLDQLSRLPGIYGDYREPLRMAAGILNAWPRRLEVPVVLMHGDYHLKNVLFEDSPLRVSGIIDWDRFKPRGWALLDALHLAVSSIASHRRTGFGQILPEIWNDELRSPLMARYLADIIDRTEMDFEALRHIAVALWMNYLWYRHVDGQGVDAGWMRAIMLAPAREIRDWSQRSRCVGQNGVEARPAMVPDE